MEAANKECVIQMGMLLFLQDTRSEIEVEIEGKEVEINGKSDYLQAQTLNQYADVLINYAQIEGKKKKRLTD